MTSKQLQEISEKYGAHNYHPLPIVLNKGKDCKVWDTENKEYLDFLSCYSALNFGHQNPRLVKALETQLHKLAVCSRAFYSEELSLFNRELAEFCGLEVVLPMNSGAEAVETALKVARKWGYLVKKIPENRANIIVANNNFHGRTITIVSFSSEPGYRDSFGPFTPGFKNVDFNDVAALENAIDENTVGVLLEPIQAEAGILVPASGYLKKVKDICTKKNVLLMLDEIQTGFGRTGKDFCYQHENIQPDILILAKSFGGGLLPVSAIVSHRAVMDVIKPGQHGSTFGGNPLGCAVARETLRIMKDENISEQSHQKGEYAFGLLKSLKSKKVKEVRGKGLLIGIELYPEAGGARKYTEILAQKGVLCKETHDHVIRIAPPLIISKDLLKQGIEKVISVLEV
jgi:ornithine--oxo-acid transaminase